MITRNDIGFVVGERAFRRCSSYWLEVRDDSHCNDVSRPVLCVTPPNSFPAQRQPFSRPVRHVIIIIYVDVCLPFTSVSQTVDVNRFISFFVPRVRDRVLFSVIIRFVFLTAFPNVLCPSLRVRRCVLSWLPFARSSDPRETPSIKTTVRLEKILLPTRR